MDYKIETKFKTLKKISGNVDSLHTDYYAQVPEVQDVIETEHLLLELEERTEELEISLHQILNSDVYETTNSSLKINNCKIE